MGGSFHTGVLRIMKTVLVTGGAGYVGSVLVPKLLNKGYRVRVLDLYIFGSNIFNGNHPNLEQIRGDIRNQALLHQVLTGCDAVIHLACISNDPSFELDPELGKSINYDSFTPLVEIARDSGVKRFIFASSSSVYGLKEEENVTEELPLTPLTDYSKFKALCEDILLKYQSGDFTTAILRPATVCGYGPRLRLDLTVNILTNHAINNGRIRVFGGAQKRPNIHIDDITDLYVQFLELPAEQIAGKIYNAGYQNHPVAEIAEIVRRCVGKKHVDIITEPTNDHRSYHISSEKIRREIGFEPQYTIEDAVSGLCRAFAKGLVPNPMDDPRYYNVKMMQTIGLK
jgi:nucleoside-diphosphate-sugar epimerase